jgi:hypothetical protein
LTIVPVPSALTARLPLPAAVSDPADSTRIPLLLTGASVSVPALLVRLPAMSIAFAAAEPLVSVSVAPPTEVIAVPEVITVPAAALEADDPLIVRPVPLLVRVAVPSNPTPALPVELPASARLPVETAILLPPFSSNP